MPPLSRSFALTIHRYFPHGGLQRIALDTALELVRRGHQVTMVTQAWEGPPPPDDRVTVKVTPMTSRSNHGRAREFGAAVAALHGFDRVLGFDRSEGLDVYFAGDPCYAARIRRTRPFLAQLTPRYRALRAQENAVFGPDSRASILLMNGREGDVFHREYGTDRARLHVLPPGYDPSRRVHADPAVVAAQRERVRGELGLSEADHVALALGSDITRKGFDRALEAVAHAVNVGLPMFLFVAGPRVDSRQAAGLARLANALGCESSLRLLGPRNDVADLLQGADVLLHPCRSEPAGMVLLEALSAGLPVLVSENAGYAGHVRPSGQGRVLAEPFDQDQWNDGLVKALREPRNESRQRALRAAEPLEPLAMVHAVASFIEAP